MPRLPATHQRKIATKSAFHVKKNSAAIAPDMKQRHHDGCYPVDFILGRLSPFQVLQFHIQVRIPVPVVFDVEESSFNVTGDQSTSL